MNKQADKRKQNLSMSRLQRRPLTSRKLIWCFIISIWSISLYRIWQGQGEAALAWLLWSVSSLVIIVSGVLPLFAVLQLRATRHIELATSYDQGAGQYGGDVTTGMNCTVTIKLSQRFKLSGLWLLVEERLTNDTVTATSLKHQLQTVLQPLMLRSNWQLQLHWTELARGEYTVAPLTVYVGDWLGLTVWRRQLCSEVSFVVVPLPHAEWAEQLSIVSWQRALQATRQSSAKQWFNHARIDVNADEFYYRPYQDGDRLHAINVHLLARGQGLHTKQWDDVVAMQRCYLLDIYETVEGENENITTNDRRSREVEAEWLLNNKISWLLQHIESNGQQGEEAVIILPERQWKVVPSPLIFGHHTESDIASPTQLQLAKVKVEERRINPAQWMAKYDTLWMYHNYDQSVQCVNVYTSELTATSRWKLLADQLAYDHIQLQLYVVMLQEEWTAQIEEQWLQLQDSCSNMDVSYWYVAKTLK